MHYLFGHLPVSVEIDFYLRISYQPASTAFAIGKVPNFKHFVVRLKKYALSYSSISVNAYHAQYIHHITTGNLVVLTYRDLPQEQISW